MSPETEERTVSVAGVRGELPEAPSWGQDIFINICGTGNKDVLMNVADGIRLGRPDKQGKMGTSVPG